jgi:hypothetical protein
MNTTPKLRKAIKAELRALDHGAEQRRRVALHQGRRLAELGQRDPRAGAFAHFAREADLPGFGAVMR